MSNLALPLFYFPSTILWVDDDETFIDAIKIAYEDKFKCLTFFEANKALAYLSHYKSPLEKINLVKEYVKSDEYGTISHAPIDLNISKILDIYNHPLKHHEISLLVIDHNMPNMTGLEFCQSIAAQPFKKILLTGETNYKQAVNAFNQGLIDRFIHKSSNVADELHQYVNELTYNYFCEKTSQLVSHLETSHLSSLSDPIFSIFFEQWRVENKITQFYLINNHGGFLTINDKNETFYFLVMSSRHAKEFVKLNDDCGDKVGHLLNGVSEGKLIPFFGVGKECWEIELQEWSQHFYPANILLGRERYAWTVIKKREPITLSGIPCSLSG
jgi:CheY-like chemotaxis protein